VSVPAVILAGGLSSRFGGGDKGLRRLGGKPLISHVVDRLRPQCGPIVLNANGDVSRFAGLGLPVLPDTVPDHSGPLAGVLAAMDWAAGQGGDAVLTVAADTPFLPPDLVARLCAGGVALRVAASPDASGRLRAHPTSALWPVTLREALRRDLGKGMRRLGLWADDHGAERVAFPSAPFDPFFNINTADDMAQAEALLRETPKSGASGFDTVIMVDWAGGKDRGPTPKADAIWTCAGTQDALEPPLYHRNRQVVMAWLADRLAAEAGAGRHVLVGFDFPFGYPAGFAGALTGAPDPLRLWDWFAVHLMDGPDGSNRYDLADRVNAGFPGVGPFWFNGSGQDLPHLPKQGRARDGHGMAEKRLAEDLAKGAFSCWQMGGAGSVGSQAMTGIAALARLRAAMPGLCRVWPFEEEEAPVTLVEIWPSLAGKLVAETRQTDEIKDAAQVRLMTDAVLRLEERGALSRLLASVPEVARVEEGWIFGLSPDGGADAAFMAACEAAARQPRRII
jgi:molybdenum cofactor guanylyltransferase